MLTNLIIGDQYQYRGQLVELAHITSSSQAEIRLAATKEVLTVQIHELQPLQMPENVGVAGNPASDEDWKFATHIRAVLEPYLHMPRLPKGLLKSLEEVTNLGARQIQKYLFRLRAEDSIIGILRGKTGNKKDSVRLSRQVEEVIEECISLYYLARERRSLKYTHSMVELRCENRGLKVPSFNVLRRRVGALNPYEVMKARFGAKAAKQKYQVRPGKLEELLVLGLVQIDHTQCDIMVLSDDDNRVVIDRPWITLAVDVLTRCVVGFYLSLDRPSSLSVGMCLSHALLPKDDWLRERGIDADWPFYGRMAVLGADNAKEFTGYSMARACDELKIILRLRALGLQHKHGHIERIIGTIMRHLHALRGTTYSNPKEKGDYDSAGKATMTLSELEAWLVHDICFTYHHTYHEGIGTTPAAKWEEEYKKATAVRGQTAAHLKPATMSRLEVLASFLPHQYRRVTREGVAINNLYYWNDDFQDYALTKRTYPFMYDPRDVTVIYGRDSTGQLKQLQVTDPTVKRMSLYEWNRLRAERRAAAKTARSTGMRAKGAANKELLERGSLKKTRKAKRERDKDTRDAAREQERLKAAARLHGTRGAATAAKKARADIYSAQLPKYRTKERKPSAN